MADDGGRAMAVPPGGESAIFRRQCSLQNLLM